MTRTRNEGFLSIKKVEEDKMNKMTIRKKAMLLVAAGMAMQSMGLTAYAKEITEPTDFTSTVKQTQSKEDVLADTIIQAQDTVKSKKALLQEAQAELDKVQPKYGATKQVYEKASYTSNQIESSANEAVLDAMKSNLQDIKNKKEDLNQVATEKANAETARKEAEDTYNKAVSELEKAQKTYYEAVQNLDDVSFKENVEKAKQAIDEAKNAVMQAQTELNNAKTQQEELSSKVSECEAALSDAQNKLQETLDAKTNAENTLASLQQQLSEANGKDNSEQIQVIQNEIQNLELEINNYNSKIESINSEVAILQSSLSKTQSDVDVAKSKVEEAKSQQENIKNQIHDLNSSISNKIDALSETKELAAQAQKSIQDKEAEIQKLNQSKLDVDKIKANISKQESIVKDKTDAWQLALNEVDQRQVELDSAENDVKDQLVVVDEKKGVLKDKELNLNKKQEDYQNLLKLNQNVNDASVNLENAKNAVVKAETVKTDLAAKVKILEKSLEQLTMEYTKLNSEKDKVDTIVACYNNLKEKKLDTEVLTIDGYESICTLLKQYKAALLDLNEKEQVYQEVKDKFDVLNTAYQNAKADYDQAVIQETNTKNDLKKHLEESNKEVEKKENDTKQSSSVNTGVETAIAGLGMTTVLGAAGAVVATCKLSRKEKHAKK